MNKENLEITKKISKKSRARTYLLTIIFFYNTNPKMEKGFPAVKIPHVPHV
jgi:hypothetical protein